MNNKLKQLYPVIFITIIVLISISLLAFTDSITKEQIRINTIEKITKMLENMFPNMSNYVEQEDIYVVKDSGNSTIGYAYLARGKGYGGYIDILVGLEDQNTIKGISIINHSESPGLGARIVEPAYKDQYNDLPIKDSAITSKGGTIDAITGATISSNAVAEAVKTTALEKVQEIYGAGGGQN